MITFIWSTVELHGMGGGSDNKPAPKCGGQDTTSSVLTALGAAGNIAAITLPGAVSGTKGCECCSTSRGRNGRRGCSSRGWSNRMDRRGYDRAGHRDWLWCSSVLVQ